MRIHTLPLLGLSAFSLLSGCAATGDVDGLRQQIQDLQATTEQSLEASRAAEAMATRNQSELAALKRESAEARRLAEDASARVDQAFDASQMK